MSADDRGRLCWRSSLHPPSGCCGHSDSSPPGQPGDVAFLPPCRQCDVPNTCCSTFASCVACCNQYRSGRRPQWSSFSDRAASGGRRASETDTPSERGNQAIGEDTSQIVYHRFFRVVNAFGVRVWPQPSDAPGAPPSVGHLIFGETVEAAGRERGSSRDGGDSSNMPPLIQRTGDQLLTNASNSWIRLSSVHPPLLRTQNYRSSNDNNERARSHTYNHNPNNNGNGTTANASTRRSPRGAAAATATAAPAAAGSDYWVRACCRADGTPHLAVVVPPATTATLASSDSQGSSVRLKNYGSSSNANTSGGAAATVIADLPATASHNQRKPTKPSHPQKRYCDSVDDWFDRCKCYCR